MSEKTTFSTKDVTEAAFFLCNDGVSFDRPDVVPNSSGSSITVFFHFKGLKLIQFGEMRRDFLNRKGLVEPKAFAAAEQDMRNILHQCLRGSKCHA